MNPLHQTQGTDAAVKDPARLGSSLLDLVTPLIITFNEAPNLERTLRQLAWARRIVVIDSYSTDETLDILKAYPQVEVFQREFDSFGRQCNFGLRKIESEWVISIDADYVLTDELIEEIREVPADVENDAFEVRFKYCVWGRPLRGTLYPPRKVLYRKRVATYVDDGHAHHVSVTGPCAELSSFIHHDDRKPLSRWTSSQAKYVDAEAHKFSVSQPAELSFSDQLRKKKILAPPLVLLYCLILHRGAFDGWAGWYYAFQRTLAEVLLALRLIEQEDLVERGVDRAWVREQTELALHSARSLLARASGHRQGADRVRRLKVLAPLFMLPYQLFIRGGLILGWRGWHLAYRRTFYELLLAIHMIEDKHIVGEAPRGEEGAIRLGPPRPRTAK